jgi:hypothetical protein
MQFLCCFLKINWNFTLSGSAEILIGFFVVIVASFFIYLEIVALNKIVWTS